MAIQEKSAEKKSLCESDVDGIMIWTCEPYFEETKCVFVSEGIPTVRQTHVKAYVLFYSCDSVHRKTNLRE